MTNETLERQPLCFKRATATSISSENVQFVSFPEDTIDKLEASVRHYNQIHNDSINIEPYFEFISFFNKRLKTFGDLFDEESEMFRQLIEIHLPSFVDNQSFVNRAETLFGYLKGLIKDCGFDTTQNTRYYEHALFLRVIKDYVEVCKQDPDFAKLPVEWQLDLVFDQVPDWFFSSARKDPRGNKR